MASRADPVTPGQKNGLFTDFESLNTRPKKKLQFCLKKEAHCRMLMGS
jgi:hypothetical protein